MKKWIIVAVVAVAAIVAAVLFFTMDKTPVLAEGFGIMEPEVEFRNVYPGWTGGAPLTIVCGEDRDRLFWVSVQAANERKLRNGYELFPEEYYSWILIPKPQAGDWFHVEAGKHLRLTITLTMPEWADYHGKETEVRIRVQEVNLEGLVQLAVESRWYIITAEE
jgi:hypothetical protein